MIRRLVLFLAILAAMLGPTIVSRTLNHPSEKFIAIQDTDQPTLAPGIVLRAVNSAVVGELIVLDASNSLVDDLIWKVVPETQDFQVFEDGKRAALSSRHEENYLVTIAGAKAGKAFLVQQVIPIFPNGPTPNGAPVTDKIKKLVFRIPSYEGKEEHAKGLARIFRETAESTSTESMLEATAVANTAFLGDRLEEWKPLLTELKKEFDARLAAGELETPEQYRTLWFQIADGLDGGV